MNENGDLNEMTQDALTDSYKLRLTQLENLGRKVGDLVREADYARDDAARAQTTLRQLEERITEQEEYRQKIVARNSSLRASLSYIEKHDPSKCRNEIKNLKAKLYKANQKLSLTCKTVDKMDIFYRKIISKNTFWIAEALLVKALDYK